jgi:hypothetical protein
MPDDGEVQARVACQLLGQPSEGLPRLGAHLGAAGAQRGLPHQDEHDPCAIGLLRTESQGNEPGL